jgi:hypothetical protein
MKSRENGSNPFIELLITPNLRTSTLKTLQLIQYKGDSYDTLLVNFPEELENKVLELASRQISQSELLEYIEKHELIPQPITSWIYTAQPLLEALPGLLLEFPNLQIYCYGSKEAEVNNMDISIVFARLTLRTIITGKVDHESWRETLTRSLRVNSESLRENCKSIQFKSGRVSACITDTSSFHLKKTLERRGSSVRVIYVEKPYHFTPLGVLERKTMLGPLYDEELEKLVFHHVDYIRNYIYRFRNRDRAHYEWALDKVIWPKLGLGRREVSLLDNLIR